MTTPSTEKIMLVSSDGVQFEMDVAAAMKSEQLQYMYEDDCAGTEIPLPNVDSKTLAKVIQYCKKHADHEAAKAENQSYDADDVALKKWDAEFLQVDSDTLFDLLQAANYLAINCLLDLTCQTVADMIKDKSPEQIRKTFNIRNDFTPEEEEEIRKENRWAFE